MQVDEAQRQIGIAFVRGGPGAIVSALVWLVAAWVHQTAGTAPAFAALFFGGILIFPLSALICKLGFKRSASVKGNPLGLLCLESTIAMIGCFFAAWLLLQVRPQFAFPLAAIAVGTHYFAFKTAYGDRTYWLLGAILTAIGTAGVFWLSGETLSLIYAVAAVELAFGLVLTVRGVSASQTSATAASPARRRRRRARRRTA